MSFDMIFPTFKLTEWTRLSFMPAEIQASYLLINAYVLAYYIPYIHLQNLIV